MNIKELEEERDRQVTGFFWLGLQIAFIFGIPAFTAAFIGKKLAKIYENNNIVTILLFISFVISWVIIFFLYQKKSKNIKKVEDEIKKLRKEERI
jgi:hypothetical protein